MNPRSLLPALSCALLVLALSIARPAVADSPGIGSPAPDVTLTDTEGKSVRLADFAESTSDTGEKKEGKVAVVTFWSYKCPTGAQYMEKYGQLAAWCKENGVEYFAVDSYGETTDQARGYREKNGIPYPIYMDESTQIAASFGARKVTATYVIDRQGKIAYMGAFDSGGRSGDEDFEPLAQKAAEQVLRGEAVAKPVTKAKG